VTPLAYDPRALAQECRKRRHTHLHPVRKVRVPAYQTDLKEAVALASRVEWLAVRVSGVPMGPRTLWNPPIWLRVLAFAVVVGGLVLRVVDADAIGDWLWAAAIALAAVLIGAGVFAEWRRK
jgi:hypothetical protein